MPEEQLSDLASILDNTDDFTLNDSSYKEIVRYLEKERAVENTDANKLISLCLQDVNGEAKKYSIYSLKVLSLLLEKYEKQNLCTTNLVLSALGILNTLKAVSTFNQVDSIKLLCFEILSRYPDEILHLLAVEHPTGIYTFLAEYLSNASKTDVIFQPMGIVLRILKILPHSDKSKFIKDGMDIWFGNVIPTIFNNTDHIDLETGDIAMQCLELLTEEILPYDYDNNAKWLNLLECLYVPEKYPALMKKLLSKEHEYWHRLWMVCVKLLKSKITKPMYPYACPINSMLPVVESAFKTDVKNRCRAFKCWNVLIDNFSTETVEVNIQKKVKLLMIPLMSNNAKVEEAALAKFNTWWHFIFKLHTKMSKFSDIALLPFLHFCFGKPVVIGKPIVIPGLFSRTTKALCVQALTNILCHYNCDGCVADLEKLDINLVTTTHLVTNWKHWIHTLGEVIKIGSELGDKTLIKQVKCVWKSFIAVVAELPENNIRRDLVNELFAMLQKLLQDCQAELSEIVIHHLIPAIFEEDKKITDLIKLCSEEDSTLMKIFVIFIDASNNNFYSSCDVEETIKCMRLSTDYLVKVSLKTSSIAIENILRMLPASESSLLLWAAFVESIMKYDYISCLRMIYKIIVWPLNVDLHKNQEKYVMTWVNMYNYVSCKQLSPNLNDEILQFFSTHKSNNTVFSVMAILTVIKKDILKDEDIKFDKKAEAMFKTFQKQVDDYKEIRVIYPYLIECLASVTNTLTLFKNINCVKCLLSIINKVLKEAPNILNQSSLQEKEIVSHLEKIIENTNNIIKMEQYRNLNLLISDGLTESALHLVKINKDHLLSLLNTFDSNDCKIKQIISTISPNDCKLEEKKQAELPTFTTPNKNITKKKAGKAANIVNTVVENGEEFVVVKSNWKFNPKKLTDNQKEKFQRKREDIPALYQDLSQSQDEFKLTPWKTESNDANSSSKSNSVSTTNETSTVLKDIPNTDFKPKIIENILKNDNNLKDKTNNNDKAIISSNPSPKNTPSLVKKDTKSPRIALKDRVFRNVRNLIEKSNITKDENVSIASVSENGSKTPDNKASNGVKTSLNANVTNSAPSHLNCARPSRVKRPPKKFVDSEIFSIKRRRSSHGQNEGEESETCSSNSEIDDKANCIHEVDTVPDIITAQADLTSLNSVTDVPNNEIDKINEKEQEIDCLLEQSNPVSDCKHDTDAKLVNKNNEEVPNNKETKNIVTTPKINKIEVCLKDKNNEKKIDVGTPKSTRKNVSKKSRIEKELAIDMVEGHPFLNGQPQKRLTRKAISNSPSTRKKSTPNGESTKAPLDLPKSAQSKPKEREIKCSLDETCSLDLPVSQDIIESSQDSSITTISVRSSKNNSKKNPVVYIDPIKVNKTDKNTINVVDSISNLKKDVSLVVSQQNNEDSMLPQNNIMEDENNLTENMDTEPIDINDDLEIIPTPQEQDVVTEVVSKDLSIGIITQELADADTQPFNSKSVFDELKGPVDVEMTQTIDCTNNVQSNTTNITLHIESDHDATNISEPSSKAVGTKDTDMIEVGHEEAASSPLKDDEQRKKDFLNNTLEISPIKTLSPVRDEKTPSPETSNDYVVIKLCSPVQSNGEPIEKCSSPEIFTEDKISPDKRDSSPPRDEVTVTHTSPLSLKKNRPQVRSGGRGAQMLGLCVRDSLQKINVQDKLTDNDETKKTASMSTPARRNLRMLYNTSENQNDATDDNEDTDNFLKFKRNLPTTDCSPSGPILKRKLADIADEATPSPASKRKRVSFHDPPVSTTVCVKKYIEPCGVRSPQNSAIKRQERQLRFQNHTPKSQRRLDKALTKTIESFIQNPSTEDCSEDTQLSSLEDTPVIDVIKTSELNNTDPICLRLVDCTDAIDNIASELSSPAMKSLLVKEFEGKIKSVGDLAKMTELEVNRLCIKAPKVQTAKKVLNSYKPKEEAIKDTDKIVMDEVICVDTEDVSKSLVEDLSDEKTEVNVSSVEMQTDALDTSSNSTQTDAAECSDGCVQTDLGNMIYEHDISTYLAEKPEVLEQIDDKSFEGLTETFIKRLPLNKSAEIIDRILEQQMVGGNGLTEEGGEDKRLSFLQQYLCDKYTPRDLVLFCSELLKKVYDKS